MAEKKNKKPQVQAPVVEKPAEEVKTQEVLDAKKKLPGMPDAMSQHDKVLYTSVLQHRKDEMLRMGGDAAEKYEALTMIEDAMILDVALTELVVKRNPAGLILSINEKNYGMMKLLGAEMGITLPDYKALPKPTKEQLAAVGIAAAPGQVVLALEDKNVSAEAKTKKKAEAKIIEEAKSKDYMKDHTKITTDDQLREALDFQVRNPAISNPVERLITSAQFYRSYLEAHAEKADDPQAELAKIHGFTLADLLQDITQLIKPTFVMEGFGKRLCTLAEDANSIIPAFCGFKNCLYNRTTGKYTYSDEDIAAFVRVIIVWYASSKTAEMSEAIKAKEANIAVLKKDAKANAKGIETEEKKIAGLKKAIEHFTGMISLTSDPSFELADNFIVAYKNNDSKDHMYAVSIAKEIMNTYYRGVEIPELEMDTALLNIQQHMGIILNLFTSAVAKRDEFSESNLIEIGEEASEKTEETTEEPKNA